jgi:mediator of RNA polymerase II transcription subunit 13
VESIDLEELKASLQPENASAWFLDPVRGGFLDPVIAAEQWFRGHAERDQQITTRKQHNHEQATTWKQLMVSSPIGARNITYGETHGAGGVYPTPPDGLASHHTAIINPTDASTSSFSDGHFFGNNHVAEVKDAMSMDLDISSPFEARTVDEKPPLTNDLSTGLDDDLFEDMDEDDFGGNDITDADFSFFDQPDGPDGDMLGKSDLDISLDDTNGDHNSSTVEVAMGDGKSPEPPMDKQDPEHAHRSASQTEAGAQKDTSDAPLSSNVEESHSHLSRSHQVERLDPSEVKKRLFAEGADFALPVSADIRPKSIFRPVLFNHDLTIVDAKYSSTGQFAASSPPTPNKNPLSNANTGTLSMPTPLKMANRPVTAPLIKDPLALPKSIDGRGSGSDTDSISDETVYTFNHSPVKGPAMGKYTTGLEMSPSPSNPIEQQPFEKLDRAKVV